MADKSPFRGIFERLALKNTLFENKEVLRESYIPTSLPHRQEEAEKLALALEPILRKELIPNILISGKNGTGKTAVSKIIGNELIETGKKMGLEISVVYLDCLFADTPYRVLRKIIRQLGGKIPFTGWPIEKVYNTFKELLDKKEQYLLLIMDRIDSLIFRQSLEYSKQERVIFLLTTINSELKKAKISLIGISNNLYLDSKIQNFFGQEKIIFQPYNTRQLEEILKERAELAFKKGVIDEKVIPLCAEISAQENGDAGKAIDLIRISGEIAEREGAEKITEQYVRRANEKIEVDKRIEAIRTLSTQSRLVLYAIFLLEKEGNRRIITRKAYQRYVDLAKRISFKPLGQYHVSKNLISKLSLLGLLDQKVVSRGRGGRTREIKPKLSPAEIKQLLEDDFWLKKFQT